MQKALKLAKLKADDIDMVLLVGGSSRIPLVKTMVTDEMGQKPRFDIDPDRAVSMGAAIQGAIITGECDAVILNRVIHSYGVTAVVNICGQDVPGIYNIIIPENAPMQKEFSKQYYTANGGGPPPLAQQQGYMTLPVGAIGWNMAGQPIDYNGMVVATTGEKLMNTAISKIL